MKNINKFVAEIFKSAGLSFIESKDVNSICSQIKENIDDIVEKLEESQGEKLSDTANSLSSDLEVKDMWKYAAVFSSLEESWQLDLPINENIRDKISNYSESWKDCASLFLSKVKDSGVDANSSQEDISEIVDYAIGCLFMAVEISIENGDEAGVDAWIMGFGDPFQYDDPVGDIVMSIDSGIREELLDCYIESLLSLYQIDIEEYRDSEESIEWANVSEAIKDMM
jgi:hypothetical protein